MMGSSSVMMVQVSDPVTTAVFSLLSEKLEECNLNLNVNHFVSLRNKTAFDINPSVSLQ